MRLIKSNVLLIELFDRSRNRGTIDEAQGLELFSGQIGHCTCTRNQCYSELLNADF